MTLSTVHQALNVIGWLLLAGLALMLALIARFYEQLAAQRTYYQLFAVPVLLFGGAAVRMSTENTVAGDSWVDLLLLAGGLTLAMLCFHMYRLMTSGRKSGGR